MTLDEFVNMFFSITDSATAFAYENEASLDEKARGEEPEVLFTLRSNYRPRAYLLPRYANATVRGFYALDRDTMALWIEVAKNA